MREGSKNILQIVVCFRAFLLRVVAATAVVTAANTPTIIIPPDDIIEEMINEVAETYSMNTLLGRRRRLDSDDDDGILIPKKRQMVHYDRPRARQCVMADWMGPSPMFNDKQFERTFRLRRSMVENIVGHLANHDPF